MPFRSGVKFTPPALDFTLFKNLISGYDFKPVIYEIIICQSYKAMTTLLIDMYKNQNHLTPNYSDKLTVFNVICNFPVLHRRALNHQHFS